jgi:hypothetical protein
MYVLNDLLRQRAMAQKVPDFKAALMAMDQCSKLIGLYSPTRVKLGRDEEELAKLTDAQIQERRARIVESILAEQSTGDSAHTSASTAAVSEDEPA